MAYLDEIESLLQASTIAGSTTGWLLFKGHLPDSSTIGDKCVALLGTAGAGSRARTDYDDLGLQVVVRGSPQNTSTAAYVDAEARIVLARDALHEYSGAALTTTHYVGVWCESGPYFAGFDAEWRPQFAANFRVWRSST